MTNPSIPNFHCLRSTRILFGAVLFLALAFALNSLISTGTRAETAPAWDLMKDHPLNGTVWTGDGKQSNKETMVEDAAGARYVLIGEIHDNPDHHRLQAQIVSELAEKGLHPALAFEMIPPSYQQKLDSFLEQSAPNDSELGEILDWEERGWPDWNIYRPIATAAIKYRLPMLAGGIDRDMAKRISREGSAALPAQTRKDWDLDEPLDPTARENLLVELEESHCGLMPKAALGYMIPVQRARDGALASAMTEGARKAGTAVMIAGAGHVRKDRGAPLPLARLDPEARSVTIGLFPVRAGKTAFEDYLDGEKALPFDYVIFTDASEPKDHCAELKARFGKKQ